MVAAREQMDRTGRSVILALPDSPLATAAADRLCRSGWQVWRAANGCEARRLACRYFPEAVVLSADGLDESGWLTGAKLVYAQPRLRIILIGECSDDALRFAQFVGAELLPPTVSSGELLDHIDDRAVLRAV